MSYIRLSVFLLPGHCWMANAMLCQRLLLHKITPHLGQILSMMERRESQYRWYKPCSTSWLR